MKIANYSITPGNYYKRTPLILKKIADALLLSILAVNPILLTIPEFKGREWFLFVWNMFIVLFKLFSKLVADENIYQDNKQKTFTDK